MRPTGGCVTVSSRNVSRVRIILKAGGHSCKSDDPSFAAFEPVSRASPGILLLSVATNIANGLLLLIKFRVPPSDSQARGWRQGIGLVYGFPLPPDIDTGQRIRNSDLQCGRAFARRQMRGRDRDRGPMSGK